MHTYELFITDDRYSVPTLKLVMASNEAGVREEAACSLAESPHHVSVTVYLNAARLFDIGTSPGDLDRPFDINRFPDIHCPGSQLGSEQGKRRAPPIGELSDGGP